MFEARLAVKMLSDSFLLVIQRLPWLVIVALFSIQGAHGEESSSFAVGAGLGITHQPEEKSYAAIGSPQTVYFDWKFYFVDGVDIRTGYTTSTGELKFEVYKTDWRYLLTTEALYVGYRIYKRVEDQHEFYVLVGPAYLRAKLKTKKAGSTSQGGSASFKDDGYGYIAGAGWLIDLRYFELGLQFEILSRETEIDGIETAVGHNMLMLTGRYCF